MADPTKYQRDYSFSDYQANNPSQPLPGPQVDNELENIEQSLNGTIDALKDVRRTDGALPNGRVTLDSLAPEVRDQIGEGATGARDAAIQASEDAANSAAASASSAGAAAGSAGTAATSAGQAMGFRNQASTYRDLADTARAGAQEARDFAAQWASTPEGVLVDDGLNPPDYSAKHYAAVAEGAASGALPDNSVSTSKIVDKAVTLEKVDDEVLDRGNHTGTQLAATISDFSSAVRASRPFFDPIDYGAAYDGTTDDRAAIVAADAAAQVSGKALMFSGPCRIGSDVVINSNQFYVPGGRLVPDSNVLVTLSGRPDAGAWQIFDRSQGGAIQFSKGAGTVWAEWWGARASPNGRTDNEVPIQHAVDACGSAFTTPPFTVAPNADGKGGVIRFASTSDYLMSGRVHVRNRTILRGNGRYTRFKANAGTWGASTEMFLFQNGASSQFWCRIEDATVDGSNLAALTRLIYAPAWQESCGLRDVLVEGFYRRGIFVDSFSGGAVGFTLKQTQFFPAAAPNNPCTALEIDSPFIGSYPHILLEDITFAGQASGTPPGVNLTGLRATGRMKIQCRGVFVEAYDAGISLQTEAELYGDITAGGNPTTGELINTGPSWAGNIDVNANKGGATYLLRNYRGGASQIFRDARPYDGRVVYPMRAGHVLASDYVNNGTGTPTLRSGANGFSSVTKPGTGLYELVFDPVKLKPTAVSEITVDVTIPDNLGVRRWYVTSYATDRVRIQITDATGTGLDANTFVVKIVGRDGF